MPQDSNLRGRIAGQSAMSAVVEAQSHRAPRGLLARILGVSPLTKQGKAHYRGAVAELLVGSILDRLGQSWDVLHGVPLGASSLDHFVVGRAGVFAIVVVNCQGDDVVVNGKDLLVAKCVNSGIVDARSAAATVTDSLRNAIELPIDVTPIVVLVEPTRVTVAQSPDDVKILPSMQLEQWLLSASAVLTGDQVAQISAAAETAQTWPQAQQSARMARNLKRAFVRIHQDVHSATLRRFLWIAAAIVVTFFSVWIMVSILTSVVMNSS